MILRTIWSNEARGSWRWLGPEAEQRVFAASTAGEILEVVLSNLTGPMFLQQYLRHLHPQKLPGSFWHFPCLLPFSFLSTTLAKQPRLLPSTNIHFEIVKLKRCTTRLAAFLFSLIFLSFTRWSSAPFPPCHFSTMVWPSWSTLNRNPYTVSLLRLLGQRLHVARRDRSISFLF